METYQETEDRKYMTRCLQLAANGRQNAKPNPEMVGEVLSVMRGLADQKMTMVVVTHEMGFAREVATRVMFLEDGYFLEENEPQEFFAHPKNERLVEFLSKVL